jgi:colanic acid biosynthesis glycosyl transferase WcaI
MDTDLYDFVIFNQSCSAQTFGLIERIAEELGPALLLTGTELRASRTPRLTVERAPSYDNSSYRTRLKTWLSFTVAALKRGIGLRGRPVVLVTTNPPFGAFVAYWLRKTRGFPYVIRVLDVYPDAISQSGLARGMGKIVPPIWDLGNRTAYAGAARVVTLGECMAERVQRSLPKEREVQIIPEWVDTASITPLPKDQNWFAKEHDQVGKLTVLYSGNLGLTHDIEGVFQAIAELKDEPKIQFMFVGGGARREEILRRTEPFPNCRVLPSQAEHVLPFSLTAADVAIVALGGSGRGISMPSKTYHMMAAGAAILGISSGDNDLGRTVQKHGIGLNLEPEDTVGIVSALLRFARDPEFLAQCRANARQAALLEFSEQSCAGAMLQLLGDVQKAEIS